MKKNLHIFCFLLLFLAGFCVRLYRFNNPVADWHSWRQADTSSVARNFVKYGFDLLHPRMENISNVQSGLENPQGYFYAEFPIYDALQAGLFVTFHTFTIEEWGRLISISMSLMGATFLFLLIKKRNKEVAWFAFIFYLFIPFNIYYSRTILPDTSMVSMLLGSMYFFDVWTRESAKKTGQFKKLFWLFLSFLFLATSLLLKPYALFYGLVFLTLAFQQFNWKLILKWELWLFTILSLAPLIWWRTYMLSYPEGIPANAWLFNSNGIRFRPAWFRWLGYERLIKLISGYVNFIFIATGLVGIWKSKDRWFLLSFIASALVYVSVIATGNVQHDYYQIVVMPTVAIVLAYGIVWLKDFLHKFTNSKIAYGIVILCMLVGFFFAWQQVQPYFDIDNPAIVEAGAAVNKLTPPNAKILAPYDGDSSFLYQTNRQGWASFEHDLQTLIKMGADYLVLVHPTPQDIAIGKQYKIVAQTKEYILFNLHQKP